MFYPHFLYKNNKKTVIDENNGEASVSDNILFHSVCKEQINGAGKLINGSDGASIIFNSIIHLPLNTEPIKVGTEVFIYLDQDKRDLRIKGTVLRFSVDMMHCRLWI